MILSSPGAVVALLAVRLIATDRQEPLLILMDPQFRRGFEAGEQSVRDEAAQVAAIDGEVYCDIKIVCRLARRITTFQSNPIGMGSVDTSLAHAIQRARTH